MIELARAGIGVGILPRWSAQRAIGSGAVAALSITRRAMRRRWVGATLAAQADPPYLVDFMDLVAERALPIRAGKPA
jgi:DNA-binding transcriptional LysR family regulator